MQGNDNQNEALFIILTPENLLPKNHCLRPVRAMAGKILKGVIKHFT